MRFAAPIVTRLDDRAADDPKTCPGDAAAAAVTLRRADCLFGELPRRGKYALPPARLQITRTYVRRARSAPLLLAAFVYRARTPSLHHRGERVRGNIFFFWKRATTLFRKNVKETVKKTKFLSRLRVMFDWMFILAAAIVAADGTRHVTRNQNARWQKKKTEEYIRGIDFFFIIENLFFHVNLY